MVVGVDQARQDHVTGCIDHFVGLSGQRFRFPDLLDFAVAREQTAVCQNSALVVHRHEPAGISNE